MAIEPEPTKRQDLQLIPDALSPLQDIQRVLDTMDVPESQYWLAGRHAVTLACERIASGVITSEALYDTSAFSYLSLEVYKTIFHNIQYRILAQAFQMVSEESSIVLSPEQVIEFAKTAYPISGISTKDLQRQKLSIQRDSAMTTPRPLSLPHMLVTTAEGTPTLQFDCPRKIFSPQKYVQRRLRPLVEDTWMTNVLAVPLVLVIDQEQLGSALSIRQVFESSMQEQDMNIPLVGILSLTVDQSILAEQTANAQGRIFKEIALASERTYI